MKLILLIFLLVMTGFIYAYIGFLAYFSDKIFPGVKVANNGLGGLSQTASYQLLSNQFQDRASHKLNLAFKDSSFVLDISTASPFADLKQQINTAYLIGRSGDPIQDIIQQSKALLGKINLPVNVNYAKKPLLASQIDKINQEIKNTASNADVALGEEIIVTPSQNGQQVEVDRLTQMITEYLALIGPKPGILPTKQYTARFTTDDATVAKQALERIKDQPIKLHFEQDLWVIDQPTLFTLLYLGNSNDQTIEQENMENLPEFQNLPVTPLIDKNKLAAYLQNLSDKINQQPQDAKFSVETSQSQEVKVKEFKPGQEGKKLDISQTSQLLTQALISGSSTNINLPVEIIKPQTQTGDVNNFGIKELVGRGVSNFTGSIENRIYNLSLAASRINGTLIPPGGTFSFNKTVGDISGASGYKPAYVIKSGRTVLDDGGGVCQVSTTVFRAALNSGLPITDRTAHAYRVGYYEQGFAPGLDATVFSPSVDFKFKNDTRSHILIQAKVQGKSLYIDLYGTKDGRVASITTPKITSQTPPPPEIRQEDPTLPKGVVKQVDWAAWGANVSFSRTVTRDGEIILSDNWRSNYRPWQAIYLVGTKQ